MESDHYASSEQIRLIESFVPLDVNFNRRWISNLGIPTVSALTPVRTMASAAALQRPNLKAATPRKLVPTR